MAVRRGVWLVLGLIFVAIMISAAGLAFTMLMVGREPEVASNSTLMLKVSGDLQEIEPGGMFGPFLEPPPTVRSVVEALRTAIDAVAGVALDGLGDGELDAELVALLGERHRLDAEIARRAQRWDARTVWLSDGENAGGLLKLTWKSPPMRSTPAVSRLMVLPRSSDTLPRVASSSPRAFSMRNPISCSSLALSSGRLPMCLR